MTGAPHFDDSSLVRRVHRERATALCGPRALLLMAAHPVAFEGFFMATGALEDPYTRLARTGRVMDAIVFGRRADADRMTKAVRSMHRRARGELTAPAGRFPAGTPWAADDPELLLWILACLVDSALLVYSRYVRGLSDAERDAYWQDYKTVGRLFGIRRRADLPADIDAFDDYMSTMLASEDLHVTPTARELGIDIVMRPPVPAHVRPVVEVVNQITIGLLPARVRRAYGFGWDPLRGLAVAGGAEYVKRVVVPLLPDSVRLVPSARAA